jgi:DNA-directed RNA polymerase alpha subunit
MNPVIEESKENNGILQFTLSGVNVSLANALRRTIISDIPVVVFKTAPYEENKANIIVNTSRLNNEILKQRLSCIPIHISDLEMPLNNYLLEVNVENLTDTIMFVTTENFKIKNLTTGDYLTTKDTRVIFPPDDQTGYFIDFVRLRPRISDEIPGEKIHLTCELTISTAKSDGMFNVVSTCSYGYSVDDIKMETELAKKRQHWKDQGLSSEEIDFETQNWKLLDGLRITKKDSFDFMIQTIGIYTNQELVHKACDIIIEKLQLLNTLADTDELDLKPSVNTMNNSFDIILVNEDYTIGKIIEYMFYSKFYEDLQTLTFCGFKKMHPHDNDSIIRIAYKESVDKATIKQNLKACVETAVNVYKKIKKDL